MNTANIFWEEEVKTDQFNWHWSKTTNSTTTWENSITNTSWQSTKIETITPPPVLELVEVEKDITDHLLDDEDIAEALNDVVLNWTKEISDWEWWSITVPDYHLRLKWIDMQLKLKWHYKEKRIKNWLVDGIYILQ